MATSRLSGPDFRSRRRWSFAGRIFDEANWALIVDGRRVAIESKPLEMLRELLLRAGNVVSKDELLDRIWPDVTVVEASLPTAVRKLRVALGDHRRKRSIIETVSGIGYRLAVPVEVEEVSSQSSRPKLKIVENEPGVGATVEASPREAHSTRVPKRLLIGGGVAVALLALAVAFAPSQPVSASRATPAYNQRDVEIAIRELDIPRVKRLIAGGWNPATPWDEEGNDALGMVLNHCEWDIGHDRRKMVLMARTLIEAGAPIDRRNVWGDTAYSIAKAPRYCGPDHPVTQMLEAMCYGGDMGPKDHCLATYELTAEQRRAQGLPPKAQEPSAHAKRG
jgi:DNA-binding winged helix-turn-helix (wHTH) protein